MIRLLVCLFGALSLAGASCQPNDSCDLAASSLDNAFHPTGSQSLAATADRAFLVSTNTDQGSITLLRAADLEVVDRIDIGAEPERIAPLGDDLIVSLRGERSLARVRVVGQSLQVIEKVSTGAEPIGLVASSDGSRLYVAVSQSSMVEERDGATLALIRTFQVEREPRWLALHPSGKTLYVATAMGGGLVVIDLVGGSAQMHALPAVSTALVGQDHGDFELIERSVRLTGDPTVRPNGTELLLPVLYIDNHNPVAQGGEDRDDEEDDGGYGSAGGSKRFIPTLVTIPLDKTGKPTATGELADLSLFDNGGALRGGYITSITVHPNRDIGFATMETSDALIAFNLRSSDRACTFGSGKDRRDPMQDPLTADPMPMPRQAPNIGDFVPSVGRYGTITRRGPVGVAFSAADQAIVHARIARQVEAFATADLEPDGSDFDQNSEWSNNGSQLSRSVADRVLPSDVRAGIELFVNANHPKMSGHDVNVACSTCHFDGRNDGLTWQFSDGPRQTPSLAGDVSATEPVTWRDDIATVRDEVVLTSQGRMGGSGLTGSGADAVVSYIDWRRHLDLPGHGDETDLTTQGRALFESTEVGCSNCHSGAHFTDATLHTIRGQRVRTPSLRGVAATAPYLHDGSAASLRVMLLRSRDGSMGNTGSLSAAELNALEAYLRSL
jgi:hypothetical protein